MYIIWYIKTFTHTHTHTHKHPHTHTHTHTQTSSHTHTLVHIITHTCTRTHTHTHTQTYAHAHAHTHTPLTHPIRTHSFLKKSSNCFESATYVQVITVPLLSATALGYGLHPYMNGEYICSSGNARPIPSASSTGSPRSAPTTSGSNELTPPISSQIR